jgi:hypothetical protein
MAYNPATDFVGLWRAITSGVEKGEMPGLDFVVAALGRAGIINLVVSGSPPIVNQDTTAWFKPATPDWAAEGQLFLWNGSAYVPATPDLFFRLLSFSSVNGTLAIFVGTGVPDNAIGRNGDFYIRTDAPGGVYGPKAAGMWPADPLPGTSYSQISAFLDFLGTAQGDIVYRNASAWVVLPPGTAGNILATGGAGANPAWTTLNATLDTAFGGTQGSILYRNATVWTTLAPGTIGQVLQTGGAGANPSWTTAPTGATGPQGPPGATGATGAVGPQGPPGPAGGTGAPYSVGSTLVAVDGTGIGGFGSLGVGTTATFYTGSGSVLGLLITYASPASGTTLFVPGVWQVLSYVVSPSNINAGALAPALNTGLDFMCNVVRIA